MTTLLQRCRTVTAKFEHLKLAQRNVNQQLLVQERKREWKKSQDKLKGVSACAACLPLDARSQKIVDEKRAHLQHNAAEVLERLKSNDDIAELTSDASWVRLLASVDGLAAEIESSVKSAWKAYIDEQGTLEDPTWLRDRAPSTPINDTAIAAYRTHYSVYATLVRLPMPRSAGDPTQLSQSIAACRTEVAKITFDVPPDLQRFFQAIQSGTANLASVTPGVLAWLAENGQLERYRVRSAGQ